METRKLAVVGWLLSYAMLPALLVSYLGTCTGGDSDNLLVSLALGSTVGVGGLFLAWRFSAVLSPFWLAVLPLPHVATLYQAVLLVPIYFSSVTIGGAHGCSVNWPNDTWGEAQGFEQVLWAPAWAAFSLTLLYVIIRSWALAYRGVRHAG